MDPTTSSPSASPEQVNDAFIGIDPDDTREVKIKDAVFTVGVIPAGIWDAISTQSHINFEEAKRRTIAKLAADGQDPEAPYTPESTLTLADMRAATDVGFLRERARVEMEGIKYGLRSHTNFRTGKGVVPWETEQIVTENGATTVVSQKVLRYYDANPKVRSALWYAILRLNEFGELEKKA